MSELDRLPTGSHRPIAGASTIMSVDAQTFTPKTPLGGRAMSPRWIPELLGYGLASGVALLADMGVLWLLVTQAHWPYLAAASLAFIAGASVAYLLSVRFVFRHRHIERRTVEFSSFVGLGLVGLTVNATVLYVAVTGAGIALMAAKVLAAGATFTTNFALRRQMLFAPPRAAR